MGMNGRSFLGDDRGVSTTVSYTLAIGITVVLIAVLLVGMTVMTEGQQNRAVDSELRVIGDGLATELTIVDRLAVGNDAGDTIAMRVEAPDRAAGQDYRIHLLDEDCPGDAESCLRVETRDRAHLVALNNETTVQNRTITGGTVWIVVDGETLRIQEERP